MLIDDYLYSAMEGPGRAGMQAHRRAGLSLGAVEHSAHACHVDAGTSSLGRRGPQESGVAGLVLCT